MFCNKVEIFFNPVFLKSIFYFYVFIQGPFEVKGDTEFGHEKVPFKWRNRIAKKVTKNFIDKKEFSN